MCPGDLVPPTLTLMQYRPRQISLDTIKQKLRRTMDDIDEWLEDTYGHKEGPPVFQGSIDVLDPLLANLAEAIHARSTSLEPIAGTEHTVDMVRWMRERSAQDEPGLCAQAIDAGRGSPT